MVSIDGKQFMPGTYTKSNGESVYNPNAFINAIFPPYYSGNNWAFSHSERKMLITLYYLFGVNIVELSMTMITNREFCHSCYRQILDFIDINQKRGAITETHQGEGYMYYSNTILTLPKT